MILAHSIFIPKLQFAIKVIDKIKLVKDQNLDYLEITDQLKNLYSLDHKGVVKYLETYNDNTNLYLVMDYIKGTLIDKYLESQGSYKKKNAKTVFDENFFNFCQQTLQAIAHCHSLGVIH